MLTACHTQRHTGYSNEIIFLCTEACSNDCIYCPRRVLSERIFVGVISQCFNVVKLLCFIAVKWEKTFASQYFDNSGAIKLISVCRYRPHSSLSKQTGHMENLVTKTDLALAVQQLTVKMYSTATVAVGVLVALDRLLPG